jgi:DnaJ-class molecular chaperone
MTAAALILADLAVWVGSLYVRPFGRCWRCHGHGNLRKRRRAPVCPRCKGQRRAQRHGSRTIHRLARQLRAEVARTRKQHASEREET